MIPFGEAPKSRRLADHDPSGRPPGKAGTLPGRGRAAGSGFVERVTIQPRSAAPSFSAMVAVHSDSAEVGRPAVSQQRVRLVWTGQRRVPGIDPGVNMAFEGMVSTVDGIPTIHNPRYEIIGRPEESP